MAQGNTVHDRMIGTLVKDLVQQIASKTEDVCVWGEETDDTMIVQVEVESSDFDRVVGRNETTARSLGVIVSAVAKKLGKRCVLQIRKSNAADSGVRLR